jgi:ribonuclease HI
MKVEIFCDGASRGNPGKAGIGIVIKQGDQVLNETAKYIGHATNNVAEYSALIQGLEDAHRLGATEVTAFCDSELLVKQIKGEYRIKSEGLKPLYLKAKSLIPKFKKFTINHTLRGGNQHADDLANKGIDEAS